MKEQIAESQVPALKADERERMLTLARGIADLLQEKKARDVIVMDLERVNPYFCFFVIATATSPVHLKSLTRDTSKRFGEYLPRKHHVSPDDVASGWVILDFIDVVVHLFVPEQRAYYNLERLWGDAGVVLDARQPPPSTRAESPDADPPAAPTSR
ncbi:MAG: ribosome silencing factor [Spirochaetales bacterium]|nr:ribosome silencing factor [Leptospiraceae bacterium]MCP5481181.1 ribosome silencing factor [Spirochaetales bacterium]